MVVCHFIVDGLLVIYQNEIKTHKETRNKSYIYFMTNIYRARFFFKFSEKMQATSLYWFATQQQTNTLRWQLFGMFYVKFSAEFNELSLF